MVVVRRSLLLLALVSLGCGSTAHKTDALKLTIGGSSTVQPLIEVIAERYKAQHPEAAIDVQGGGSSVGVSAPRKGLADIGMVSRDLTAEERDLTAFPIALDGIALIAHGTNTVQGLTRDQVFGLFSGTITHWKDVGGPEAPVVLVNKEEGRATLEVFEKHFGLKGKFAKNAVVIGPNGQAISFVAGNPHALGYVSIGSAEVARRQGTPIRLLPLDGIEPSSHNVRDAKYPLQRSLLLVTKTPPSPQARVFLDYVLGVEGQKVVAEQDFVPVAPATADAGRAQTSP